MIKPPFAAPLDFTISLKPSEIKDEEWYIFSADRLLVHEETKSISSKHPLDLKLHLYLGTYQQKNLYAGTVENDVIAPKGWIWSDLRSLHNVLDEDQFSLAGRALQLIDWDRTHLFCGRCGSKTFHRDSERCRECSSCKLLFYPKITPVILALIRRKNKILLARSPNFTPNMYSVIAGFVDPGETLEQCVHREVFEEVGLKVDKLEYFSSQPWPFSRSLMIGFICESLSGDIKIDTLEIEDAAWFDANDLPLLPSPYSLSRLMIDSAF